MVVVMGVLLVTSMLGFAVAATAQRTNGDAVRDADAKRSLAAAETSINLARFNLGKAYGNTAGNDGKCYPDVSPSTTCAWSAWQSVGNGARVRYWVSPVLSTAPGITCVTAAVPPNPTNSRERCVTAQSEVGGVQRQLQTRVVENRGAPLFPFPGLLGLDRVALNQSDAVGTVGTNGQLSIGAGSDVRDPGIIKLGGPSWSVTPPTYGTANREISSDPFILDHYTEWYSESVRTPPLGTNEIGLLTAQSGFSVSGTRQVSLGPGASISLTGGKDYNFCSLNMNAGAQFIIPASTTEPVRVFIDSSSRLGSPDYVNSGCANLTGDIVNLGSGAGFVNQTGKPSMMQLFVHGGPSKNIRFNASANFTGTLWAPQSNVLFNNGATLTGAMAAKDIQFNNNGGNAGFVSDNEANNVTGRWDGSYKRNGWRECSARIGC